MLDPFFVYALKGIYGSSHEGIKTDNRQDETFIFDGYLDLSKLSKSQPSSFVSE